MALSQVDQLNRQMKLMQEQMTKMKTEKTQLTTKVSSLEQIVLQLLTYQTQRMNIDNFKTN